MPGMDMDVGPSTSNEMGAMAVSGMSGVGWSWNGFVTFLIAWAVMMAAMMFPAAAPMILLFHKVAGTRTAHGRASVPTWVFAAGYLLVWTAIGGATWIVVHLVSDLAGRLGTSTRDTWAPLALGAVLTTAGLYQFTPLKTTCLRHCQSPVGFVMTHWRDGRLGALRMGLTHGAYCLGCCWMLFAVLVVAGVMSLAWMLALTLVVFAEKILPVGSRAVVASGVALVALGLLVASGATAFPWPA
jgi:predicted metal-binding membrane protein